MGADYPSYLAWLICVSHQTKNTYPMKSTNQPNFLQGPYQAVPIFKYVQYLNVPFYSMNYILTIITFFFQHGHGFARQHVNSSMSEKRGKILSFQRFSVSSKMTVKFDFLVRTDTQNYQCRNEITRPNKGIRMEKVKGVWKFWSVNDAHADWKIVNVAKWLVQSLLLIVKRAINPFSFS